MPETDVLTEQLRALGDLGLDELRLDAVRECIHDELTQATEARRSSRPGWRTRGALVSAICVVVAIAVVAGALVLVSGGHREQPARPPGASRLIARLAVLRRPQTPADRLPADVAVIRGLTGTIQPRLTRLVARRPGIRLYLVVSTPARQPGGLDWPASLGDQVSLIAVRGHTGQQSPPVPAADLDNATQLITLLPRVGGIGPVQIVPDGVARVHWTYPGRPHGPHHTPHMTTVTNNLANTPPPRGTLPHATWLRADGTVVPTSDALEQRMQAATIAHDLAQTHNHSPAALLNGFAVFAEHTLARGGITVTRPHLQKMPLPILGFIQGFRDQDSVDVAHMRVITFPSGRRMWVLPMVDAMAVVRLAAPGGPPANDVFIGQPAVLVAIRESAAAALAHGVELAGADAKGLAGTDVAFGVLPRGRPTVRVPTATGERTIRPPLGAFDVVTKSR
jgi:hypothetical protein